jgi:HlyD family secretion protein
LEDIQKGARGEEQSVIEAKLLQAQANADNLKAQANRNEALYKTNAISKTEAENSAAAAKASAAQVEELQNSLKVSKLSARDDQIKAQKARVKQIEFAVKQAEWKLEQKALKAVKNALVFDTIYREGEFVPTGSIVVRLLPPENIKIKFFVPQKIAEKLAPSQKLFFYRSGDGTKFTGSVSYISAEAEYTPPLIYSNESKERLVFMVEAYPRPEDAKLFRPGQPVKVSLDEL